MTDQADPTTEPNAEQPTSATGPIRTRVAPRWMRKMVIFLIVCFGLGTWGLLDAAVSVAQQLVPQDTTIVSTAGRAYGDEGSSISYRSAMPPLLCSSERAPRR